jgi:Leucine-rich repeat (LRR) protein
MHSLKELLLMNNLIEKIDENSFDDLVNLETIDISYNNLTEIKKDLFAKLNKIKRFNLSNNKLTTVNDSKLFENKTNINYIDFSANNLGLVDANVFRNLSSLVHLSLMSNRLVKLDYNLIQGCDLMQNFCLYGNKFPPNYTLNYTGLNDLKDKRIFTVDCFAL